MTVCTGSPKPPPAPPPPAPPPIKMNERVRPSVAKAKSRRAAVDSTSALIIPMNRTDVGPGVPS